MEKTPPMNLFPPQTPTTLLIVEKTDEAGLVDVTLLAIVVVVLLVATLVVALVVVVAVVTGSNTLQLLKRRVTRIISHP